MKQGFQAHIDGMQKSETNGTNGAQRIRPLEDTNGGAFSNGRKSPNGEDEIDEGLAVLRRQPSIKDRKKVCKGHIVTSPWP